MTPEAHCNLCHESLVFHKRLYANHPLGPATNVFVHPRGKCEGANKIIGALGYYLNTKRKLLRGV